VITEEEFDKLRDQYLSSEDKSEQAEESNTITPETITP